MSRSRRRGRHHDHDTAELNITAFMNMMVILVPFLLITAVFSQVAILELNLPSSNDQPGVEDPEAMTLEIIVRRRSDELRLIQKLACTQDRQMIGSIIDGNSL